MKLFWSFIALFILATLGVMAMEKGVYQPETDKVAVNDAEESQAKTQDAAAEVIEEPALVSEPAVEAPVSTEEPTPDTEATKESPAPTETPDPVTETETETEPIQLEVPETSPDSSNVPSDIVRILPEIETPKSEPEVVIPDEPDEDEMVVPTESPAETPESEKITPTKSTKNDLYTIKGQGTKEDPYRVTWELLTSAYETYRPRDDKNEIPKRITDLHEKYVRITGYLAFPQLTGEVDEALVMLNEWDGCCLGVPPQPYDSIEVRMGASITTVRGPFSPFGSVMGKLQVDPYLVNGWLVGLYLMDDATVELTN